jgi:hypothetical protein
VKRQLAAFGADDFMVSAEFFPEDKIEELKPLFTLEPDDPDMEYVYQVPDELRDEVSRILGIELKPELNYNIEAVAD